MSEAKSIPNENPKRLRECLEALSQHGTEHVIRAELRLVPSTDDGTVPTLTMVVTHSLSLEHELVVAKAIGAAFNLGLAALLAAAKESA